MQHDFWEKIEFYSKFVILIYQKRFFINQNETVAIGRFLQNLL